MNATRVKCPKCDKWMHFKDAIHRTPYAIEGNDRCPHCGLPVKLDWKTTNLSNGGRMHQPICVERT